MRGAHRERGHRPPPARQRPALVALERGQLVERHSLECRGARPPDPRDQQTAFGDDEGVIVRRQSPRIADQAGEAHCVGAVIRAPRGEAVAQRVAAGARLAAARSRPGAVRRIGPVGDRPRRHVASSSSTSPSITSRRRKVFPNPATWRSMSRKVAMNRCSAACRQRSSC